MIFTKNSHKGTNFEKIEIIESATFKRYYVYCNDKFMNDYESMATALSYVGERVKGKPIVKPLKYEYTGVDPLLEIAKARGLTILITH